MSENRVTNLDECESELYKIGAKLVFLVQALDIDDDDFHCGLHHILEEIRVSVYKLADDVSIIDPAVAKVA